VMPESRTSLRSSCGNGRRPCSYGGPELQSNTSERVYNAAATGEGAEATNALVGIRITDGKREAPAAQAKIEENSRRFIIRSFK
jgi:hypothetical protein